MKYNLGGSTPAVSTAGTSTRIKGNQIVNVIFEGAFAETIEKKDKSATFDVLKLKFKDDTGLTFEDTIFEPREGDDKRKPSGFEYDNPSRVEELQFKIRHLFAAVDPAKFKQIQEKGIEVNSWNELRKFVETNTTKARGTRTQIKLVEDKDRNATFPAFVLGINSKTNEVYAKTNFIGADLTWTTKEKERMENAKSAKATDMQAKTKDAMDMALTPATGNNELDLDDLNIDLA